MQYHPESISWFKDESDKEKFKHINSSESEIELNNNDQKNASFHHQSNFTHFEIERHWDLLCVYCNVYRP